MAKNSKTITVQQVSSLIFNLREQKVILDSDLARLYSVATKALNRAVKRNAERFPEDFVLQLTNEEMQSLRCQNGTSSSAWRAPVSSLCFYRAWGDYGH